jgi:hypothetical protein
MIGPSKIGETASFLEALVAIGVGVDVGLYVAATAHRFVRPVGSDGFPRVHRADPSDHRTKPCLSEFPRPTCPRQPDPDSARAGHPAGAFPPRTSAAWGGKCFMRVRDRTTPTCGDGYRRAAFSTGSLAREGIALSGWAATVGSLNGPSPGWPVVAAFIAATTARPNTSLPSPASPARSSSCAASHADVPLQ